MRTRPNTLARLSALILVWGISVSVNFCAIGGSGDYLLKHTAEEKLRYLDIGLATESVGVWHGAVANHFGIEGKKIEPEVFKNVIQGFSPDGNKKLTQNAGSEKRDLGWEGVIAPHKSVSDLLAVLPPERWHEVLSCHNDAVKEVARCIEEFCGVSRRGKGGLIHEPAGLIIGEHLHLTNRENEMHIHTHFSVMNVGLREDGTFGAIVSKLLYTHQRLLNAVYQQTNALFLRERLGVVCDVDRYAARVRGVPETFIKATSTRSAQIEAAAGPQQTRSERAADVAALTTRKEKDLKPVSILAREWAKLAERHGFTWKQVIRRKPQQLTEKAKEKLIKYAIEKAAQGLVTESPVFDRWQLLTRTLTNLIGKPIEYTQVIGTVRQALNRPEQWKLVDLGEINKERWYTTPAHIRLEERLVRELEALAKDNRPLVRPERVEKVLADHPDLKAEQQKALRLLSDGGRLSVLTGFAGTGKTTALKALYEMLQATFSERRTVRPLKVIGVSVSGRAADTLQTETGIESMTLAKLLKDLRPTPLADVFRVVRKIKFLSVSNFLKYAEAVRRPKLSLDRRTTVILDEASLASTKDLLELAHRINRRGGRLVLVGDPAQKQAIGPAGGLDLVIKRFPERTSKLQEIRRQEAAWEREAVKNIVQGGAKAAIKAYEREGKLTVATDATAARETAVKLYADGGGLSAPKEHLLLANTNQDVRWLNQLTQNERLKTGLLHGEPLRVRGPSLREVNDFYLGDRVMFLRNAVFAPPGKEPLAERLLRAAVDPLRRAVAEKLPDWARVFVEPQKKVRVRNGQFGTILAVAPLFSRMLLELDTGERVVVNLAKYQHLSLGYSSSVFKAQSTSVNHVYALVGDRMTDRESAYVAASRGRLSTNLVVDGSLRSPDLACVEKATEEGVSKELIRQVEKSHKQVTAIEHRWLADSARESLSPPPPPEQEIEQEIVR